MPRRTWTTDQFIEAVKSSISISEVLRKLNLTTRPGNFRTFHKYVEHLKLSTNHFDVSKVLSNSSKKAAIPLKLLLINGSNPPSRFKKRLIESGLLKNKCYICNQLPIWNGILLILQLDHINRYSQ